MPDRQASVVGSGRGLYVSQRSLIRESTQPRWAGILRCLHPQLPPAATPTPSVLSNSLPSFDAEEVLDLFPNDLRNTERLGLNSHRQLTIPTTKGDRSRVTSVVAPFFPPVLLELRSLHRGSGYHAGARRVSHLLFFFYYCYLVVTRVLCSGKYILMLVRINEMPAPRLPGLRCKRGPGCGSRTNMNARKRPPLSLSHEAKTQSIPLGQTALRTIDDCVRCINPPPLFLPPCPTKMDSWS